MTLVKVAMLEDQLCIVLPPKMAAKLGAAPGKELATSDTERGVELIKGTSEEQIQMQLAEQIMDEDREVLRRLAE
ncbi:MAG: hypothetical protein WD851_19920 [Pirellulales bacterium]